MRRSLLVLLASALAGAILAPPGVSAAARFRDCPEPNGDDAVCARVTVPLDRSGAVPGTLRLLVQREAARRRRPNVLVLLVGGPGQSSTPLRETIRSVLGPALRRHELVVFDERGTGAGALRCPTIEGRTIRNPANAAAACAARLGPARASYTTRDSIADLEAVRDALGAQRMSILGVSYGTKVALGYAAAHPDRVDHLALDSPVAATGPDPFARSSFAALPRVLRDVCRGRRCAGVTRDVVGDLDRFVSRLSRAPLRGTVIGARGQRRPATLRTGGLLELLLASDVDPTLLAGLPAAVRSADRGDGAPILRIAHSAAAAQAPEAPRDFSTARLVTTLCEELAFPWTRTADLARRRSELSAATAALGEGPFAPFGSAAAVGVSIMPACVGWPAAPSPPAFATTPPGAPTLLVSGTGDLRTPLEDARAIAAGQPDARVLTVLGIGHSVLSSTSSTCPARALGGFLSGRPVRGRCPRDRMLDLPPDPVAPRSLGAVDPFPGLGGRRGRTVGAVLLTLGDLGTSLLSSLPDAVLEIVERGTASAGGLRGGYATLGSEGIALHRVVYVPGVVVSGTVRFGGGRGLGFTARFRVSGRGALHGTVALDAGGTLAGRLGGRTFRVRAPAGALAFSAGARPAARALAGVRRLDALRTRKRDGRPRLGRPPRLGGYVEG